MISPAVGELERIATGMSFSEGPVWLAEHGRLLLTDIPANRIMSWSDEDGLCCWSRQAHFAIGLSRDADGRVIACEHSTRTLAGISLLPDGQPGERKVLTRSVYGRVLNSTNDVIVSNDGTVMFTDPPFGVRNLEGTLHGYQQAMELPRCSVFRVTDDPDGPEEIAGSVYRPNGLCLSPDESVLYVSDSSERHHKVVAFNVGPGFSLSAQRDFAVMPVGVPDGMRADREGNVWIAGGDGIYIHGPDGQAVGHVAVPEMVTNLEFGGSDLKEVFITATTSLYRVCSAIPGALRPHLLL